MAVEALPSANVREEWIAARIKEFDEDPSMRDRALATILYDSLTLTNAIMELSTKVREEGVGGLIKGLMSGGRK